MIANVIRFGLGDAELTRLYVRREEEIVIDASLPMTSAEYSIL